jgi:hypothetical protein
MLSPILASSRSLRVGAAVVIGAISFVGSKAVLHKGK